MNNEAAHHEFADVLALVQEQIEELSAIQQERSMLCAKATAAEGTVEVTVDAQCVVSQVQINESYLTEFEFADLGGYIAGAAQEAAHEIGRRAAALFGSVDQRRQVISERSGMLVDAPDFADVMAALNMTGTPVKSSPVDSAPVNYDEPAPFPTVRTIDG